MDPIPETDICNFHIGHKAPPTTCILPTPLDPVFQNFAKDPLKQNLHFIFHYTRLY